MAAFDLTFSTLLPTNGSGTRKPHTTCFAYTWLYGDRVCGTDEPCVDGTQLEAKAALQNGRHRHSQLLRCAILLSRAVHNDLEVWVPTNDHANGNRLLSGAVIIHPRDIMFPSDSPALVADLQGDSADLWHLCRSTALQVSPTGIVSMRSTGSGLGQRSK